MHITRRSHAPGAHRSRRLRAAASAASVGVLAVGLTLVSTGALTPTPAAAAPGSVTGTVFRDFNADGFMNTTATEALPAVDVGVAGVTVSAYGAAGGAPLDTATTAADGTYELSYDTGVASAAVRVEFSTPAGYMSGPHGDPSGPGVQSGTTVQFVSGTGTANLGLARPGDYSAPNPVLVFPVHRGFDLWRNSFTAEVPGDVPTLYATNYTSTGQLSTGTGSNNLRVQATLEQTGNVWGTAPFGTSHVFTAAVFKRHAPVGPGGLGAIYLTEIGDGTTPNAAVFATIPNAGVDPRGTIDDDFDWFHDVTAFPEVGKIGLGDMDLSTDGTTLYAVNLNDRQLWAVPVSVDDTDAPVAGTARPIAMPLDLPGAEGGCDRADVRPYGLDANSLGVWATLTCTGPDADDLRGYVYRYDEISGTFDEAPAFEFALGGARGNAAAEAGPAEWGPWYDADFDRGAAYPYFVDAQPILSDVTFDSNDDMSIGIKDRSGDMVGGRAGNLNTSDFAHWYEGVTSGDLVRACRTSGGWDLEDNGSCGGRTGDGVNNTNGFGGGEFYNDNWGTFHDQIHLGSSVQVPGFTGIVATTFDPINLRASGFRELTNADGGAVRGIEVNRDIYYGNNCATYCIGTFSKANGMGDIEAMLEPAPIEIGNRVWIDTNGDGVQGPADVEPPVGGVTVHLYDGDVRVGTAVTAADGSYYFNADNVEGGVQPNTQYRIAVDEAEDYEAGGPLVGHVPTTANAGGNDSIDSDGVIVGGYPSVTLTTGAPGANDHTFDFGFLNRFDLALRKTLGPDQQATVRPGDDVTFRITVFNQGQVGATDIEITDTLPPNTTLNDDDWTAGSPGTASITLPGPLAPGAETFVDITVRLASDVAVGTELVNTAEISAADDPRGVPATDVDSVPNTNPADDGTVTDDAILNERGDQDDHDIAEVTVLGFDLALRKTTTADIVGPGDLVPFTITVFNQGGIAARNVVVTDMVPAGMTFDVADNAGWTLVDGRPTTTIAGPLAAGTGQASVTINLRVRPGYGPNDFTNIAEISAATDDRGIVRTDVDSTPDTDANNDGPITNDEILNGNGDQDDHDIATVKIFDLALRKTTEAGQVQVGDVVPFTITVINQGSVAATGIQITDYLPAELEFDADENVGSGWTVVDGNPTIDVPGSLAPGAPVSVTINLTVVATADQIDNFAEISAADGPTGQAVTDIDSTPDADDENDGDYLDNEVGNANDDEDDHDIASIGSPLFDLALRKTLAEGQGSQVWPGDDVTFTITVFNQGRQNASDIVVTDHVPAGMTFDPADNAGWTLVDGNPTTTIDGPIEPGGFESVTIVLGVTGATRPGDLVNTAEISAADDATGEPGIDADSNPNTNPADDGTVDDDEIDNANGDEDDHDIAQVTVPVFDLALRKTLAEGQAPDVFVGDDVRFTITVFNQGAVTATNVVVADTLPAGLTFDADAEGNEGWSLVDGRPTTTIAGPIGPGGSASVELVATVTARSDEALVNTAEISSASDDTGTPRTDVDSTPNTDPTDDGDITDDEIDNDNEDEDDHDIAQVNTPVFDLALRKTLTEGQASSAYVGADVSFTITVFNQGEVAARNIVVTDSLPVGLAFDPAKNPTWTLVGGRPTTTVAGPLAIGGSASVELVATVIAHSEEPLVNTAEISSATDDSGTPREDVDSTPNTDPDDDGDITDDEIDNGNEDEDDHDIAIIDTKVWDLSLRKTLSEGQASVVETGDLVRYTITVTNEGTETAHEIVVTDFVPDGTSFRSSDNPGWTLTDGVAETTIAGPLAPGASASVEIALVVTATGVTEILNVAEIESSIDENGETPTDIDSIPDRDRTNDPDGEDDIDTETITTRVVDDPDDPVDPDDPGTTTTTTTTTGALPRTGSDLLNLAVLGLVLLGGGVMLRIRRTEADA